MTASVSSVEAAIETRGLSKHFGHQAAVDDVDLTVPHGAIFGFLGPNGSGKTTTIRMMLGLAAASSGQIRVLGQDMPRGVADVLPRVGALVEGPAFYPFLSGAANLRRLDTADPRAPSTTRTARVGDALEKVGLTHAARKKVRAYSLGMKQRLGLANALLSPRELLVLDEPTNGLDPQGTREVRNLVRSLAGEGTTVFVSSHLLAEVEQMCTHAAVMSAGSLVAQGTLDELRRVGQAHVTVRTPDAAAAAGVLVRLGLVPDRSSGPGQSTQRQSTQRESTQAESTEPESTQAESSEPGRGESGRDEFVRAPLPDDAIPAEEIVAQLVADGIRIRGFAVEGSSLEDRFVALTGEGFDVAE